MTTEQPQRREAVDFIAGEPWAITESGMRLVLAVVSRDEFFAEARAAAEMPASAAPAPYAVDAQGVATIPVKGPIVRHAPMFAEISGACSQDQLRGAVRAATTDPSVRRVVMTFDSPGGEARGVADLGDDVARLRQAKRVDAFVTRADSAAYWLASQCSTITIAQDGEAGSIGAIAVFVDESKADEMAGRREIRIVSSQSPRKAALPTTATGRDSWQARLDTFAGLFVSAVAAGRRVSEKTVLAKFGAGDVFMGAAAVAAGLADRVGTFEQVASTTYEPAMLAMESDMKCSGCSAEIPDEGPAYCADCAGKSAKALGLAQDATTSAQIERATILTALERDVLAATGQTTAPAALGVIAAWKASHERVGTLAAQVEQAAQVERDARASAALNVDRARRSVTPAMRERWLPSMLGAPDKPAAITVAADGAIQCSGVTVAGLAQLDGYLGAVEPIAAPPPAPPPDDEAHLSDIEREIATMADRARGAFTPRGSAATTTTAK